MSNVKWIKITTDVFDNWKIKHIKKIPEIGHSLVCVWFELLCMAGSCNENGMLVMSNRFVATDELIADTFNEDLKLVRLALQTFEQHGMIEITDNNAIQISNWNEYQSGAELEKIREQNRARQQKYREKQKPKEIEEKSNVTSNVISNVNCSYSYSLYINNINNIISYLNINTKKNYSNKTKNTIKHISARLNEGFTEEDFYRVIDYKVSQWGNDEKMKEYLRPDTLFGTKFESYLQAAPKRIAETNETDNDDWQ